MYTHKDVEELIAMYGEILAEELKAQNTYEAALSGAYLSGQIDGKNPEMRDAQVYKLIGDQKFALDKARVMVKVIDAHIGLAKALLYSSKASE